VTTLPSLIRGDALDAELGALLWMLVEGRTSVLALGPSSVRRTEVLDALFHLRPDDLRATAMAVIGPDDLWGGQLVEALHSVRAADGFAATMAAGSLREALEQLSGPGVGLTEEELRVLGVVVVLDEEGRLSAAHLLRPVERDMAGHLQRRPPAVLSARDPTTGQLEHFAWGAMPEIADRVDREQADMERRLAARARLLVELAADGDGDAPLVRERMAQHIRDEPPRVAAPERPPARDAWPAAPRQDTHTH